ncbi:hypothetical protein SFR_5874 [Streptomyces sp. FR-008]|nr:hypothetical protein SFR_5874 [Streptomyces sp. FR-008]
MALPLSLVVSRVAGTGRAPASAARREWPLTGRHRHRPAHRRKVTPVTASATRPTPPGHFALGRTPPGPRPTAPATRTPGPIHPPPPAGSVTA